MKGVVLAGGLGSRLYPLTHVTNKHLLPIYNKPMVYYPLQTLAKAGITEVMLVVGGPYAGHFIRVLKNGEEFGFKKFVYAYQEGEGGIPVALGLAEKFAEGDSVCVVLGDNTTDEDISDAVRSFKHGAEVFLKKVPDPQRFGVPVFKNGKIVSIEEKPLKPKSDYAVTGLYIYDNHCFSYIKELAPSKRNELEITDLNNKYLALGDLKWTELKGYWRDAGTFDTLFEASTYWFNKVHHTVGMR